MAVLTPTELVAMRRQLAGRVSPQHWNKAEVNAALQAVEDRLVSSKSVINNDIETAAPGVFNAAQKKLIVAYAVMRFALGEEA